MIANMRYSEDANPRPLPLERLRARLAGAGAVVAVDPVEFKRETALELGATLDEEQDHVERSAGAVADGYVIGQSFDVM